MDDKHADKAMHLTTLGVSQVARFERLGYTSDLENTISNGQEAVRLTDDSHPSKLTYLVNLGIIQRTRFEHIRCLPDLEHSISNLREAVQLTDDDHPEKPAYISNLGLSQLARYKHLGRLCDLDNAISNQAKAVELVDDNSRYKAGIHSNLGISQRLHLNAFPDLNNAIFNINKAIEHADTECQSKALYLLNLGITHQARFKLLAENADYVASVTSFKAAAQLKVASPRLALAVAREWATESHLHNDLISALDGYYKALELLPRLAWLGLGQSLRQDWLRREKTDSLSCLSAASCAIRLGRLDKVVELLDLGRSVLWQQASSLRSDLEILRRDEPRLAEELERVGRLIDAGNFSDFTFTAGEYDGRINEEQKALKRNVVG